MTKTIESSLKTWTCDDPCHEVKGDHWPSLVPSNTWHHQLEYRSHFDPWPNFPLADTRVWWPVWATSDPWMNCSGESSSPLASPRLHLDVPGVANAARSLFISSFLSSNIPSRVMMLSKCWCQHIIRKCMERSKASRGKRRRYSKYKYWHFALTSPASLGPTVMATRRLLHEASCPSQTPVTHNYQSLFGLRIVPLTLILASAWL